MQGDIVQRELECALLPHEVELRAKDLADKTREIQVLEQRKKDAAKTAKLQIDGLKEEVKQLAEQVSTKKQTRVVDCRWEVDHNQKIKLLFRTDTDDLVEKRPLEPADRQRTIFDVLPGGEDEADTAEG